MKSSISAIVSWPDSFDFPLFRDKLPELLKHVDEVLICFTQHGNHSLREWIKENSDPRVKFLNAEDGKKYSGDWRNQSTNLMIDNSTGDVLLSLEQDFLIKDYQAFFTAIHKALHHSDVIFIQDGERFHPCFLAWKRKNMLPEKRNFSVMGTGQDHFCYFTKHLKGQDLNMVSLDDLNLFRGRDWFHLCGVTDNYFAPKPYYDLDAFYFYNDKCKQISCSDYWKGEMERCTGPVPGSHLLRSII